MPIATLENKKQSTADGIQTTFPFPYKFFKNTDLKVYVGSTLKTITTDYSVVGIGSSFANGANVVFTSVPGAGSLITIVRVIPVDQPSDYKDYASFPNEQFNADLDRHTMIEQQLQEQLNRVAKLDITEPGGDLVFPGADARRGGFLAFDSSPEALPMASPGVPGVATSAFMATLLDDPDAPTARTTLGALADAAVSAFMKTVLDDPTAAAARVTLGVEQPEPFTPAAGYTPAAADVVELLSDATIRRAKRVNRTTFAAGSAVTAARVARLDATHAVVVYCVGLNLNAVIVTVNPVDLSITFGTVLSAFFTFTTAAAAFDVAPIDGTHVLVAYSVNGVTFSQGTVKVLTANIGAGTLATGNSANTSATSCQMALYPVPGTSNIALVWFTDATHMAASIISGGTTPVYNTPATMSSSFAAADITVARPIPITVAASGDLLVALESRTTLTFYIEYALWSISGTTVTGQTPFATVISTSEPTTYLIEEGPPNAFILCGRQCAPSTNVDPSVYGVAGNFMRTSPVLIGGDNLNMSKILPSLENIGCVAIAPVDRAAGVFAVVGVGWAEDNFAAHQIFIVSRKGLLPDFSVGDNYRYLPGTQVGKPVQGLAVLPSGIILAAFATASASGGQSQIVAMRRRNTVFGIAVDGAGNVQRRGTFITSGLTPGARYYADDNGALTTVRTEVEIGFAKSATELDLDIRPGV